MSAPQPDDVGILGKLLAGVGAALSAIGVWAWTHTHKRIDDAATSAAAKADKLALERLADRMIDKGMFEQHTKADEQQLESISREISVQRQNIGKLFDRIDEAVSETQVRFTVMDKANFERHIELLQAINSIKGKK